MNKNSLRLNHLGVRAPQTVKGYRDPYTLVQSSLPETLLEIDRSGVVLPLLGFTPFYLTYRSGERTLDSNGNAKLRQAFCKLRHHHEVCGATSLLS